MELKNGSRYFKDKSRTSFIYVDCMDPTNSFLYGYLYLSNSSKPIDDTPKMYIIEMHEWEDFDQDEYLGRSAWLLP